jgi:transposase-like protein
MTEEQKLKVRARGLANVAVSRGKLVPQPCQKCGKEEADKHHDDYAKPLEVRWLCRRCHKQHHREQGYQRMMRDILPPGVKMTLAMERMVLEFSIAAAAAEGSNASAIDKVRHAILGRNLRRFLANTGIVLRLV